MKRGQARTYRVAPDVGTGLLPFGWEPRR